MVELSEALNSFEVYKKLNALPFLDGLLKKYLRMAKASTITSLQNQGELVELIIGKEDLSSKAVIFHEKCEIAAYLDFGYSQEDIGTGKAHKESYFRAHNVAEELELKLLQQVAKHTTGKSLPLFTLFLTRPVLQLFDEDLSFAESRVWRYIPDENISNARIGGAFKPIEFNASDVQLSFEVFENFGSQYLLSDFKERCSRAVEHFVSNTNRRYAHLSEPLSVESKSVRVNYFSK